MLASPASRRHPLATAGRREVKGDVRSSATIESGPMGGIGGALVQRAHCRARVVPTLVDPSEWQCTIRRSPPFVLCASGNETNYIAVAFRVPAPLRTASHRFALFPPLRRVGDASDASGARGARGQRRKRRKRHKYL